MVMGEGVGLKCVLRLLGLGGILTLNCSCVSLFMAKPSAPGLPPVTQ